VGVLQAVLSAQLIAGPAQVSDSFFPSATKTTPFGLNQVPKQYQADTSAVLMLNSPSPSFENIDAIGVGGQVTQVLTFYCRSQTPLLLQMTFLNINSGMDIVVLEPLYGVKLSEYPPNAYLKALAVQGSGQFEYWAAGLL
jgi:hypothetical protein